MTAGRDIRRLILDASAEEFAKSGVDGARIHAIVKRAGVNERMLYHHFGSKKGLYEAVLVDQRASIVSDLSRFLDTDDARKAFRAALAQVIGGMIARPYFLPLMLHEAMSGWRHMPAVTTRQIPKTLSTLFTRSQRQGAIRKEVSFTSVYLAAIGAVTAGYFLSGRFENMRDNPKLRDRMVEDALDLVLRGAAP